MSLSIRAALSRQKHENLRKVLTHPDPCLSQQSVAIDLENEAELAELDQLATELIASMRQQVGAGLAAIQVGIPKRVFVYDTEGEEEEPEAVLVNPEIVYASEEMIEDEEGCLSFPALYAPVSRHKKVIVEGFDRTGTAVRVEAEDFRARVFQHEIDHLDGISFVARLSDEERKRALQEYFDLRAG